MRHHCLWVLDKFCGCVWLPRKCRKVEKKNEVFIFCGFACCDSVWLPRMCGKLEIFVVPLMEILLMDWECQVCNIWTKRINVFIIRPVIELEKLPVHSSIVKSTVELRLNRWRHKYVFYYFIYYKKIKKLKKLINFDSIYFVC